MIQEALPFMKHDGSAAIVTIGSIAGGMGTNGMYSATKFPELEAGVVRMRGQKLRCSPKRLL